MKEILIPLNFTTTPVLYDSKQSFSASDEESGVLTFTTTADVSGTVASLTIRNARENANRQTVLIERLDVNSSPFSYAVKMPLPFGNYEGEVLLKKNLTVLASAKFLFGVNSSLSAEVLPKLVEAYSLDNLVEEVETEVSNLKDAYSVTVSETVKGVNQTESKLQASENVRYLNEDTRKNNNALWKAQAEAFALAEENRVIEFNDLVDSAVIEQVVTQEVAEKYQEIVSLNAQEMVSFRQQLAETSIEINRGMSTNGLSNGGGFLRQPSAAFTFDDGYMNDYTLLKPVMDEFGVKGTLFINTDDTGYEAVKLSDVEIKQLHSEGWEFGSHTRSHTKLSYLALNKSIGIGDTTIEIINNGTANIKAYSTGTKIRVRDTDIVFTTVGHTLANNVLTLALNVPSAYAVNTPKEVYLHEESVLEEILAPKKYLNSLGIECSGLAYPWGSVTEQARKVIQSNFIYARNATDGNAGTNGGVYDGDDIRLKQFELNCSELPTLTDVMMDDLITKIISEKGLLIVLGHTNGWSALEPKLRLLLTKLQAAKIDIQPLSKALISHGNTLDIANTTISKNGLSMFGGLNIIASKGITASTGVLYFPVGETITRHTGAINGFPTDSGVAVTVKTRFVGTAYWCYQYWYEMDSNTLTNSIYHRIATGSTTWSAFKRITSISLTTYRRNLVSFPRVIGDQVFDTNLGKPIWCKVAGAQEVDTLTVTGPALASGNITIKLNTTNYTIPITSGMTTADVATAIRNTVYNSWVATGSGNVVVLKKDTAAVNQTPTFTDTGSTGVAATFVVTVAGEATVWVDATGASV